MQTDNPILDYERWSSDQADREAKLPVCDYCKEPIQEDKYHRIDDLNICCHCLEDYEVWNDG